ncbi:ATP-binding protein [Pseudomonas guariconensis]|uniref:ATP-binding protein n=1 Tax=Pseudomonas guariconensis TaxID=1288410 RepID=UPI0018AC8861|nr:ATP-binding protein [Pseudomonas guariconensis]MBF8720471.1 AAA family ATPase [Pseudomonas guariconensis]
MATRHTSLKKQKKTEFESQILLRKLRINTPPFRKLKKIEIEFAERITLIAGHNGIGKSTILALIANGSGITDQSITTYAGKSFTGLLDEIIHIDYESEFLTNQKERKLPNPYLDYTINGLEFSKRCGQTKREVKNRDGDTYRLEARVVPRNLKDSPYIDPVSGLSVGVAAKVPLPTIYLGMTRMIPVGEADPESIETSKDNSIDPADAEFIDKFIQDIISIGPREKGKIPNITTQSIVGTKKSAKHPDYKHSPKSISLGQDSLSAIATALASFKKLQRDLPDYPGGLLVIDELDAGLHPHAQEALINSIKNHAKNLRLQVVATTHSLYMIEMVHPENNEIKGNGLRMDSVVYLTDSIAPRTEKDMSLEAIKNDMTLTAPKIKKEAVKTDNTLKIYLEDAEANFFLSRLLTRSLKIKVKKATKKTLKAIPISVGCQNLQGLQKFDPHFKTVLIVVDADSAITKGLKNVVKLPGGCDANGNGYSPERTLYEFALELMADGENYPSARQFLKDNKITSNQIDRHLIKGETNIKDRVSAKKWMRNRLTIIEDWGLVDLWLNEHPDKVEAFESALMTASIATARLTP